MAAGAGGDKAVRLRLDWHISQLYDFDFLLWNVQAVHCHPSIAEVRGFTAKPFLVGEETTDASDEFVLISSTCKKNMKLRSITLTNFKI